MIRLFSEYRIFAAILLPVAIISYIALNLYFPFFAHTSETDLGLFGTLVIDNPLVKAICGGSIVFVNALMINLIFNNQNVYEKTVFLPAFIYIVWMSFSEQLYNPNGFLLAHTSFILVLTQLFQLNQNEDGRRFVFNAGLFAGLATCLHPIMIVILPFLFMMIWIMRPFLLRESLLIISGFITPVLYALSTMLIHNNWYEWSFAATKFSLDKTPWHVLIIVAFVLIFTLFSITGVRKKLQNSSIRFRKLTRILWFLFFVSIMVGIIDLMLLQTVEYFSLLFVVLSFFSIFSFVKKPLSSLSNGLFVLVILVSLLKFFL